MKTKFLKSVLISLILLIPFISFADVLTIKDIDIQIQTLRNNQYQLFIKFDLPEFPDGANIDYAVLSLGMNVESNSDSATIIFEVLSKDNASRQKLVAYNNNPIKEIITRRTKGLTELKLDITELVTLWVKEGESNEGIVLVSHRNIEDKHLRTDKVSLATDFKAPTLRIFYTVIE